MNRYITGMVAVLAVAASCLGQEVESKKFPAFNAETGKDLGTYPPNPVVDFVHMKLVLDIPDMNTPRASVEQTLTVAALAKRVDSLTLDAHLLEIVDVKCEGHSAKFTTDGSTITISFDPPLEKGVKTDIVTRYAINDPPYGLFWTPESPAWPGRAAQVHSQGQAETNSYWFPCHDFPNERLTTELIVTVPAGYIVSSNGREAEPVKHTGNRDTFHWLQDKPHVNYLVSLVVGRFDVVDVAGPGSRVPMPVYVAPGRGKDVKATYGNTPRMIELFEKRTGHAYPWDRYAQLTVWNFGAGGMENTSATTMYDSAILSPEALIDTDLDGLISHELGHQWFGDLITCKSWEHTWLNEGGATYMTNLWFEERDGKDAYLAGVRGNFDSVIRSDKADAPFQKAMVSKAYTGPWEQFGGKANPYAKGSSILHMLRAKLGDEVFFRALGVYFQKHHFGLIETNDFRRIMEDESGESLDRFVRQWCYRPGVPELDMTIAWDDSRHELVVSGKQTQNIDGYNPAFDLSIPVWAAESSGEIRRLGTLEMEEREFEARFPMGAEPRIVEIDPGLSSLAKLTIHQPTQRWVEQAKRGHTWAARCQAVRSLAEDKSSADAAGALALIAKDDKETKQLRAEAVNGLGKRHNAEALLEISGMALPPDVGVAIMEAAADLGKDEDVESRMRMRFKELLTAHATADRSERVRAEAITGLGKMKASDRLAIIAQAANVESQNDRVRQAAIGALAELESPDGLPIVLRYTQPGTYNRTRTVAIDGAVKLAKYGPDVVYSTLASMLDDREARARSGAGAALAQLGDKRALDDLAKLKDSRRDPRDKTTVEGWIDATKKKLGVEVPKATASAPGAGFLWVPIAEPSRWATSEGDKELLAKNPEAFFARFGLVTGSYQGTEYLLCSDREDARMLGGEGWKVADVKVLTADAVRSIAFELNEPGSEKFGPMTERNIGRPLAMIVDGKVYSAPNLRSRIEGSGQITGTFSEEDAEKLAAAIKEPGKLTLRVAAFVTEVAEPQMMVKELKEKGPGGEVNK